MSKKKKITIGLLQFISTLSFIVHCFAWYNGNDSGAISYLVPFGFLATAFLPNLQMPERLFNAKKTTGSKVLDNWFKLNSVLVMIWGISVVINVIIPLILK